MSQTLNKFLLGAMVSNMLLGGCQQSQEGVAAKTPNRQTSPVPAVVVDNSTPDKALKSYWQTKDAVRKAEFDWDTAGTPERQKLREKADIDFRKLMSGDVLSGHQNREKRRQNEVYSREILDIKQDTESRATAVVKVKNSTPLLEGTVVTESDDNRRAEGQRLKYILEKESDGWKVAQVYHYSETNIILKREPWEKVFKTPSEQPHYISYVNEYEN